MTVGSLRILWNNISVGIKALYLFDSGNEEELFKTSCIYSMPIMQYHFLAGADVPPQPLNAPGTLDARQCQYHSWKPSVIICIKHNRRAFVQCVICMCPEVLAHVVASRKQERCRRTFNTRSNQTLHYCVGIYVHNSKILFVENLKNIISLFFLRFYLMVGWVRNAEPLDHELLLIALFKFWQ